MKKFYKVIYIDHQGQRCTGFKEIQKGDSKKKELLKYKNDKDVKEILSIDVVDENWYNLWPLSEQYK